MGLSPKLDIRQTQSLAMTPQLLQSIRLLQLTHVELEQFIESEIESNPLLEREGGPTAAQEAETAPHRPETLAESISARLDSSLENVFPDDPGRQETIGPDLSAQWRSARGNGLAQGEAGSLEAIADTAPSLRAHIGEQIVFTFSDPVERLLAQDLFDNLDDAGYLTVALEDIAIRTKADLRRLENILKACQGFDPPGLFARDLSECLALQLKARDRLDPAMEALVSHLDLLAKRDFPTLKRICGVGEEDLMDMLGEIRALDPKPGAALTSQPAAPVQPDVFVKPAGDGGWAVELNADTLPRVLVNEPYFTKVSAKVDQADKAFLSERLQSAHWLARSLDQRAKTILKVASEIVRLQDSFLAHGIDHLRPLTLRAIAEAIGMHESTVSRVVANKFMMTPRGLFELRYFFTTAIASADSGDAHSAEAVRHRIRQLIDAEKAHSVLSDDAIVDTLRREGVEIARRTVAKYREAMNIPSSVQRRREKKARAAAEASA
ncbi:RNA polymerase factor sigma-54 [Chelativorans sp. YIM 93263]|uniref:RNA polymerase factor sigma-54 n=1 Tax=Chelativorans sp. YIM 93263 TaxID=2906648 RepID=UPI00237917A3|nr:RNA polymerase factor sigma-54 [Chelativorans sp. YIM 93263]